uniref:Endonuclease/exonuclease/phosphatase domain-containing protein n=1 Tax=Rhodnius prolixus TaxID=13249 RepID=T1HJN9_RHOPR
MFPRNNIHGKTTFAGSASFDIILSEAVKEKSLGRASGGIMVLLNRRCSFNSNLIYKDDTIVLLKLRTNSFSFILGVIFWRPIKIYDLYIPTLAELLQKITTKYSNLPILIGGDFNSRIGSLNCLDEDIFNGSILIPIRETSDVHICLILKRMCGPLAWNLSFGAESAA